MARAAAIFDLDRTLLPGASGRVLAEQLRASGVIDRDPFVREPALFSVFDRIGETLPGMLLTRQGVRFTEGWYLSAVRAAGNAAARRLVDRLQPYARRLIDDHVRDGRLVVMATTSPETENDVDLRESFAYSDSFNDRPLLRIVGHPVAVNPDPRLGVIARFRGWPVRHLDVPQGVLKLAGVELHRALTAVVRPQSIRFARFDVAATEHMPRRGSAIVAANHRSYSTHSQWLSRRAASGASWSNKRSSTRRSSARSRE